jgi:hypothetical protein
MELIGKDEQIIDTFSKQLTILSGQLEKVIIYQVNYTLIIDLEIKILYSNKDCKLRFIDIKEYYFYYNSDHYFYNIESFKLFRSEDFFYISLDPADESSNINENDQDFILSRSIEGYLQTRYSSGS